MVKGRRIILLSLLITLFLFSAVYGETLGDTGLAQNTNQVQPIEGFSEPRYTIFADRDDVHTILSEDDEGINLEEAKDAEIATNYDELKAIVHKNMKDYKETFYVNYKVGLGGEQIKAQVEGMWKEIFDGDYYLYGTASSYGGILIGGYVNDAIIKFQGFSYHTTKTQEEFVDAEIERIAKEIIKDDMSDLGKVKAVNDWVVNNTRYNEHTKDKYGSSPHAAYTLLAHGEGVCQAYALTANRLLDEAGIESMYVTGKAWNKGPTIDPIDHAWNLVKLDGEWYHLDTTWNDPVYESGANVLSYAYFLKTDAAIENDHDHCFRTYKPGENDNHIVDYPKATDTKYKDMWNITDAYEYDDFIYYNNYSDYAHIHKIKTDGTGSELLNGLYHYGYIILPLNHVNIDVTHMWTIALNQSVEKDSVNYENVYIENEFGDKLDDSNFKLDIAGSKSEKIIISVRNGFEYERYKVYYVVVDKGLQSAGGDFLKQQVKLPFIIK